MKRGVALLVAPLMLGAVVAQSQPQETPPSQVESPANVGAPPSEHIYSRKDGAKAPRPIDTPDPKYPKKAHNLRGQNMVILQLVVGSDGLPRDIKSSVLSALSSMRQPLRR